EYSVRCALYPVPTRRSSDLGRPALAIGLKGLAGCQIDLTTITTDLHSGSYGAAVPNAIRALCDLAATFHAPDGSVAVEGFYDDVDRKSTRLNSSHVKISYAV